ncbi:MAG: dTDP-glucose 4,6-dehydratase [Verrucomicrobiae bacterium]|nr:dTDP-glucose 4,6-dehydratase [Verrucomicrobiae bacterium]
MKLLVTGGCGFIGSHFVREILATRAKWRVVNVDGLTYAGRGRNLDDLARHPRYRFVRADIAGAAMAPILARERPDAIVNFAAESHVDRSIHGAAPFLRTNALGVQNLLDAARGGRFLQVSTDEVYGSIPGRRRAREDAPLRPSSAYSASKAAADLLVLAARHTHGQDVVITRCTNNYGPWQFPEKLIPLMITNALVGHPLPVYGDGLQRRDWIHARDHCRGVLAALERGRPGEIYNFGAGIEPPNLVIVRNILRLLGKPTSLIRHVADRLGHDRRYAVDTAKARRELGWRPRIGLADGLAETVRWYRDHPAWWLRLKDAAFRAYYRRNYGGGALR